MEHMDFNQEPILEQEPVQEQEPILEPQPAEPTPSKKSGAGKIVAVALACALLGGAAGASVSQWGGNFGLQDPITSQIYMGQRDNIVLDTVKVDTNKLMTPAEVYAANVSSTVGITTSITTENYWGVIPQVATAGSGFILTEDGYIVTNYHVVEGSNAVSVSLYDGTRHDATVVGYDATNDLAVLKVDATGLSPVVLGDSDNLNVGDPVVAIGNPLGELTFSLTSGAVSAKDRSVSFSDGNTMNLLQTDCAINSGNSGGPLFNLYGEVIGITNAKYSSSYGETSIDNIAFAIPMNSIMKEIQDIIEKGYISRAYIGVSVDTVREDVQKYGIPAGAEVITVTEDGPAHKGGLMVGDIVTHVNDTEIKTSQDLVDAVQSKEIGETITLTVFRKGQTLKLTVTTGESVQQTSPTTPEELRPSEEENQGSAFPWPWGGIFGGM